MTITIYHNPKCSKSRACLELVREAGHAPVIVEYLKTPPSRATLEGILARMGAGPRDIMRTKEAVYGELGLAEASDEALLDAMVAHPVLIERPLVVTDTAARVCRPPELVADLL